MAKFIAEIDPQELAVRILTGFHGFKPPAGKTAKEALDYLLPDDRKAAMNAAHAAAQYFAECLDTLTAVS